MIYEIENNAMNKKLANDISIHDCIPSDSIKRNVDNFDVINDLKVEN